MCRSEKSWRPLPEVDSRKQTGSTVGECYEWPTSGFDRGRRGAPPLPAAAIFKGPSEIPPGGRDAAPPASAALRLIRDTTWRF